MHRPQSRERRGGACDYGPINAEGYVQRRNYIKPSRMELGSYSVCRTQTKSNSIAIDFQNSSKKETITPLRATLAEEMSTERQIKRSSPNVIARLMGLDALPSSEFLKPHKEVSSCSRKILSEEMQKPIIQEDYLLKKPNSEYEECKDVFEIIEGQQVENHKKQGIRKQIPNLKDTEIDMAFIRQSFVNAKRLSTDEKLQKSKEFDDALEVLESNKDLFLKLLQEPHSLFSGHLQNRTQSSPSQHANHASVRKSSRESMTANHESPVISEINVRRYTSPKSSDSQSLRQHDANSNGHPFREPECSFPEKYSDSIYGGNVEDSAPPTHIVILKPRLSKARKVERTVQSVISLENTKTGVLNHRELSKEEIIDLFQEERGRQNMLTLGSMRLRTKHTTELAKNVTQQMRSRSVNGRRASVPKYSNYIQDDDLWPVSCIAGMKNSPTSYRTSNNNNGYDKSFSYAQSSANESSVSLEARKHLSEQRRLTRRLQEIGLSMRVSNTLSDILSLSDGEITDTAIRSSVVKKSCSSAISIKDGLKDGFSRNLMRSKSLPSSSLIYGIPQNNTRNGIVSSKSRVIPKNRHNMNSDVFVDKGQIGLKNSSLKNLGDCFIKSRLLSNGGENRLPEREIHLRSEDFKDRSNAVPLTEEEHMACNFSDIRSPDIVDSFSVPSCSIAGPSLSMKCKGYDELHKVTRSERDGELIASGHGEMLSKQESSSNHGRNLLPSSKCSKLAVEADQPSPVSVLDLSSNNDKSPPGCFKKISDDLEELRRQLQILKFDSGDNLAKEIEAFISNDDDDDAESFSELGDIHHSFRDEDDRDYSYLLDMLIDSGILKSDESGLSGTCHSTELPVGIDVFDDLEKKYKSVELWSRSERKLFFDLVNSTITDIASTPFKKKTHEGLVEEIWQAVVKRREGVSSSCSEEKFIGLKRFDFLNTCSEVVGKELENLISENLMDELVEQLLHL